MKVNSEGNECVCACICVYDQLWVYALWYKYVCSYNLYKYTFRETFFFYITWHDVIFLQNVFSQTSFKRTAEIQ
jgi:hypothetical protein